MPLTSTGCTCISKRVSTMSSLYHGSRMCLLELPQFPRECFHACLGFFKSPLLVLQHYPSALETLQILIQCLSLPLDGHQVLIAIQSEREWRIFCESVLGQPELAEDERFINNSARVSHRNEMDAAINAVFGQINQEDLVELLDCTRIANGRLSSVEDLSNHEFLKKQTVTYGGTAIELAALPVPVDSDRPDEVPTLNQHGDRIRQEFQG